MHAVAFILDDFSVYWYSVVLALAVLTGLLAFFGCCRWQGLGGLHTALAGALALMLGLTGARLLYWYCRPDSFSSFAQALTTPVTGHLALAGAFLGCGLAAALAGIYGKTTPALLDAMSLSGCAAIALGRLASLFSVSDRGQLLERTGGFPWVWPVTNAASGALEYRLATFLLQAALAGILCAALAVLFFSRHRRGDVTAVFLTVYCAGQVLLDSTRYDSLYLRSNGFVSMVQVLSAATLAVCLAIFARRALKVRGLKKWMVLFWAALAALFGGAGYMEYYVQRHGSQAAFAYSVMGACLGAMVALGLTLWAAGRREPSP